jgi:hypothetical protein
VWQDRLRLGQLVPHVHGPIQPDSGGELGASLLSPPYLEIEHAETEVGAGCERTRAEFVGQGQGLAVVESPFTP